MKSSAGLSEPVRKQVEQRTGAKVGQHLLDGGYMRKDDLERAHAARGRQAHPLTVFWARAHSESVATHGDNPSRDVITRDVRFQMRRSATSRDLARRGQDLHPHL